MTDPNPAPAPGATPGATPAAPPPKKKGCFKRILKVGFVLFVLFVLLVVLLPTILTKFVLKGQVRSQLQKQTGGGDVAVCEFSWSNGLLVDGLVIPGAAPWTKQKDRPAVKLDHFATKMSVPAMVKAALGGGQVDVVVEAQKCDVYLELHPNGKLNIALPEPEKGAQPATTQPTDTKPAEGKPAEPKPLPCTARAILDVKAFDVEIADCTSSTGAIQRTVLKNFKFGVQTDVAKDMTAKVAALKDAVAAVTSAAASGNPPAVSFDSLKVTLEEVGKQPKLVIAIDKFAVDLTATYSMARPASADMAPIPALAAAHQADAKPVVTIARCWSDDFDLNDLKVDTALETPGPGKKVLKLLIDGVLKGAHQGKVHLVVACDLASKPKLPVTVEVNMQDVDISGSVGKYAPTLIPVLGGASTQAGAQHLPPLTFTTKADLACQFDDKGQFQKDPTMKSIKDDGEMKLGPGNFEGSKILQGFMEGFDKIDMKDIATKALGDSPFSFEGMNEVFNVKDGTVNVPKCELARKNCSILMDGSCTFDGDYKFGVKIDQASLQKFQPDVAKLMACVEKAGGIQIAGKMGGEYTVTTPPADALAKAMVDGGAWDIFSSRNPNGAKKLNAALGKYGTSVEKLQSDPKAAGKDAAKTGLEKAADSKTGQQIEKKIGISPEDAKKKIGGLFGGGDDKKPEDKPADAKPDDKKPEEKKDDGLKLPPIKNPFGGN